MQKKKKLLFSFKQQNLTFQGQLWAPRSQRGVRTSPRCFSRKIVTVATSGWGSGDVPLPGTPPVSRKSCWEPCSGSSISLHGKLGTFGVPWERAEPSAWVWVLSRAFWPAVPRCACCSAWERAGRCSASRCNRCKAAVRALEQCLLKSPCCTVQDFAEQDVFLWLVNG